MVNFVKNRLKIRKIFCWLTKQGAIITPKYRQLNP